jgi:hypothetical protein
MSCDRIPPREIQISQNHSTEKARQARLYGSRNLSSDRPAKHHGKNTRIYNNKQAKRIRRETPVFTEYLDRGQTRTVHYIGSRTTNGADPYYLEIRG